jgi:acyl carrier protein
MTSTGLITVDDVREAIGRFLEEALDQRVAGDAALIGSGLVDSFQMVELLAFVELRFGVEFRAQDARNRVDTIDDLAAWVADHGGMHEHG